MRIKDILAGESGTLEKNKSISFFVLGSKTDSEEDDMVRSEEWIKKGLCPRCGGKFEKRADGKLVCRHDGLILTEGLKQKGSLK